MSSAAIGEGSRLSSSTSASNARPCGSEHLVAAALVAGGPVFPASRGHPEAVDQDDRLGCGRLEGFCTHRELLCGSGSEAVCRYGSWSPSMPAKTLVVAISPGSPQPRRSTSTSFALLLHPGLYEAFVDESLRERWLPEGELRERTASRPRSARFDWGDGETPGQRHLHGEGRDEERRGARARATRRRRAGGTDEGLLARSGRGAEGGAGAMSRVSEFERRAEIPTGN
jgi:hypothetical protein